MRLVLSHVSHQCEACGKPPPLDRHHRKHQALFVSAFRFTRGHEARYRRFVRLYHAFRPHHLCYLCRECHYSAHLAWDNIIWKDIDKRRKELHHYTWLEAEALMDKLGERFTKWLEQQRKRRK